MGKTNTAQSETSDRFVIAALGASVEGLAALEGFFEHMPRDAGVAFIVVQQFSADHVSAFVQLLSDRADMPVEQVQDKTEVAPDRVYVVPPNATATIKDRILYIVSPTESGTRPTPIDSLFCSLAEDSGEYAVCIILSGTGTDGTRGLRAVTEHGGLAMAQNLQSAQHNGTLRSAIATGLVDYVLPVQDMPPKLLAYATRLSSLTSRLGTIPDQFAKHGPHSHRILRPRVGDDFSQYKEVEIRGDDPGSLTRAVSTLVDVTGRRNVEEELRKSEEQLRYMFEQTSSGIAQMDLTGRFLKVNDGYCRIVGRTSAELMKLRMQDITHAEDLPSNVAKFVALAEGRSSNFVFEKRFIRPDGEHVWVNNHLSAIRNPQGEILCLAAAITDINERKRADEAHAMLVSLVESSDDAIISKDLNGIIRSWNAGAERIFGYTQQEAIGRPVTMLIPPAQSDEEHVIIERIRRGERVDHYETVRRRKDGSTVNISLTVSPIVDARGQIVGASKIARDITDRKRVEEERRDLEKRERAMAIATTVHEMEADLARVARTLTIGELATSIAHEVNQPLAGIVTNAEACLRWLDGNAPNLPEAQASLALIIRDGNRASEVIHRIRQFLKKDSSLSGEIDINEVIQDAVALAKPEVLRSKVVIRMELSSDLPHVWADHIQLQQVMLNLIMNGCEAMTSVDGKPRELGLFSQKSEDNCVLVAVQDSGAGLDPEKASQMFDPFFTTKPTGMGMGLSISRSIVEAHGGRIWATHNIVSGMTFHFTLPIG